MQGLITLLAGAGMVATAFAFASTRQTFVEEGNEALFWGCHVVGSMCVGVTIAHLVQTRSEIKLQLEALGKWLSGNGNQ